MQGGIGVLVYIVRPVGISLFRVWGVVDLYAPMIVLRPMPIAVTFVLLCSLELPMETPCESVNTLE